MTLGPCRSGLEAYFIHTVLHINHHSTTLSLLCVINSQVLTAPSLPDFSAMVQSQSEQPLPSLVNLKIISSENISHPLFPLVANPFLPYPLANIILSKSNFPRHLAVRPLISFCRTFLAEKLSHYSCVCSDLLPGHYQLELELILQLPSS